MQLWKKSLVPKCPDAKVPKVEIYTTQYPSFRKLPSAQTPHNNGKYEKNQEKEVLKYLIQVSKLL